MTFDRILVLGLALAVLPWGVYLLRLFQQRRQSVAAVRDHFLERIALLPDAASGRIRADRVRWLRRIAGLMVAVIALAAVAALALARRSNVPGLYRWLVLTVALVWLAVVALNAVRIARLWRVQRLTRREVLVDLGVPSAFSIARPYWTLVVFAFLIVVATVRYATTGRATIELLIGAALGVTIVLGLISPPEHRRLTPRGLISMGGVTPWGRVREIVWSADGAVVALRRAPGMLLPEWVVLPVPAEQRPAVEAALRDLAPHAAASGPASP